jgi:thiol-disulfide isomerase/thioredoxin
MKKFLFLLLFVGTCFKLNAQIDPERSKKPYEKFPSLPAFYMLGTDSSTIFNTYYIPEGRPTVLFYFSPDCEHCQITCKEILDAMDSLKEADFYFATFSYLSMLKPFAEKYKLDKYKNIKMVGKDYQYFFPDYYGITTVPCIVVYDRHKQLVKSFNDAIHIRELAEVIHTGATR